MAELGALTGLVAILKRYAPLVRDTRISGAGVSLIRRAADAITNMAHENVAIKTRVRVEDGIAPLVSLLDAVDIKVLLSFHILASACTNGQQHSPRLLPRLRIKLQLLLCFM